ncbi:MAG: amidohydrolase [Reinekea sp.]
MICGSFFYEVNVMQNYWQETLVFARDFRRALHTQPELAWQETNTAQRIRQELTALDIPWRACAETGTLATLAGSKSGKHIALRGDIDALAIFEKSNVEWASQYEGKMHACGHDGHTAALLASARWLKHNESLLERPVSLIFQPAEEGGHGAKRMIEEGALDGIDEIYGWHNWPAIKYGEMVCPDGVVMCGNGTFTIHLTGIGGHASQPEICADPVLAAAAITLNLQQIVSRRCAPQSPVVVSVTNVQATSGLTVIPESAILSGSIRVPDKKTKQQVNEWIEQISIDTARTYGVECRVEIQPRYNATINHAEQAATARQAWCSVFGKQTLADDIALPIMASEDFSYYLEKIPGAFALIGADDGENHHHPCHSPYYDFNDQLLEKVVRWYARLAGVKTPNLESK